jgi:mono/diheme cytochrome c family protein
VGPEGRSLVIMPSQVFVGLTDEDLGRIIGFLKSLPVVAGPGPSISVGPVGRAGLAIGKLKLAAQLIAETVPPPEVPTKEAAYGRHVARTTCAQCHGTDLRSEPGFASPDLRVVVAAYSPEAFSQMLRTGVGPDGRNLGGMSAWARNNLSHLTDSEIAAVYSYLRSMPESVRN